MRQHAPIIPLPVAITFASTLIGEKFLALLNERETA
jgi:hypothetical protein